MYYAGENKINRKLLFFRLCIEVIVKERLVKTSGFVCYLNEIFIFPDENDIKCIIIDMKCIMKNYVR